jgi:hypothetical protein
MPSQGKAFILRHIRRPQTAAGASRGRRRTVGAIGLLVAVIIVLAGALGRGSGPRCPAARPAGTGASWLLGALGDVPCPAGTSSVYGAQDNLGEPVDVLDPIAAPGGGYLGVYQTPVGHSSTDLRISLGRSPDLLHWTRVGVLDASGASMPTLRRIPGTTGYLLAYEKAGAHSDSVRVRYYAGLAELEANRVAASVDLPRRLSGLNNGTPAFAAIDWGGGLRRSAITLTFHYESEDGSGPGPDREAIGILRGFRTWTAKRDSTTDALLDSEGLTGSHGDQRFFTLEGHTWRVLEAESRFGDLDTWHVVLYDPAIGRYAPVALDTPAGRYYESFANPVVSVLPAPPGGGAGAHGEVLAVTMFVFSTGGAASQSGELVFYRRLPASA